VLAPALSRGQPSLRLHLHGRSEVPKERLRPTVQLGDPSIRIKARRAVPSFDLSILPEADPDQPGSATDPESLALPSALHHSRVPGQGRHVHSLERGEDACGRSLDQMGTGLRVEGRETGESPSPVARLTRPPSRCSSPSISPSNRATRRRASGYIVGMSIMSAHSSPCPSR
jgi:hypothetical protein